MPRKVQRRDVIKGVGAAGITTGLSGCFSETGNGGGEGPEALFVIGYPKDGVQLFLDYYSTSDGSEDILVPDGLRDGDLPGQVGNDMANVVGTAPAAGGPAQEAFSSAYQDRYDDKPGVFTAQSYDSVAVQILANAMGGENDGEAVRDQMRNVANPPGMEVTPDNFVEGVEAAANGEDVNYQGASSNVNFNEAGDPANSAYSIWEYDGQDGGTSDIEVQNFEGDQPDGSGPSADDRPGGFGRTIDVGILLPSSGNLASVGVPMISAAEMPVKEVNEADIDLEVNASVEDTETNSSAGTEAAQRLVSQGVPSVCGTASSSVNVPVSESVLIENGVVGCSPSSTALAVTDLEDDDYIFRTAPSDVLQGSVDAQIMSERIGATDVATIYLNNDYGQQLNNRFVEVFEGEFDGNVLNEVGYNQAESSYSSVVEDALSG